MTITNDKLIFMSGNNNNPTKSAMYSYIWMIMRILKKNIIIQLIAME